MNPLRVGRVDFINTFPLAWSLEHRLEPGTIEETLAVPTALNALLAAGELDVANVSSIAYALNAADWVLLPSVCIASEGEVDSVNLVTDVPLPAITSIAVTAKSAASGSASARRAEIVAPSGSPSAWGVGAVGRVGVGPQGRGEAR